MRVISHSIWAKIGRTNRGWWGRRVGQRWKSRQGLFFHFYFFQVNRFRRVPPLFYFFICTIGCSSSKQKPTGFFLLFFHRDEFKSRNAFFDPISLWRFERYLAVHHYRRRRWRVASFLGLAGRFLSEHRVSFFCVARLCLESVGEELKHLFSTVFFPSLSLSLLFFSRRIEKERWGLEIKSVKRPRCTSCLFNTPKYTERGRLNPQIIFEKTHTHTNRREVSLFG